MLRHVQRSPLLLAPNQLSAPIARTPPTDTKEQWVFNDFTHLREVMEKLLLLLLLCVLRLISSLYSYSHVDAGKGM
ncbi:unnamed protein product [Merluccius merluccius]